MMIEIATVGDFTACANCTDVTVYDVHAGARKHKMKGMGPSMTKEIRAKARSASRSRRERSAQTRGELRFPKVRSPTTHPAIPKT